MCTANTVIDQFNTTKDEVFMPYMKIQSNNVLSNLSIEYYPKELKMLV